MTINIRYHRHMMNHYKGRYSDTRFSMGIKNRAKFHNVRTMSELNYCRHMLRLHTQALHTALHA